MGYHRAIADLLNLPDDLVRFLASGWQLEYDTEVAEPGQLVLRSIGDLVLREIYHSSAEEGHPLGVDEEPGAENGAEDDPHYDVDEEGYYAIPAVDLIESCTHYPPECLLFWLPDLEMFGTWDGGHFELLVFPNVRWTQIVEYPVVYVNAQWRNDPPGYYLAPWLHGYPYRKGWPDDPSD